MDSSRAPTGRTGFPRFGGVPGIPGRIAKMNFQKSVWPAEAQRVSQNCEFQICSRNFLNAEEFFPATGERSEPVGEQGWRSIENTNLKFFTLSN